MVSHPTAIPLAPETPKRQEQSMQNKIMEKVASATIAWKDFRQITEMSKRNADQVPQVQNKQYFFLAYTINMSLAG